MEEMPVEVSTADAERIGVEPPEVGTILTMDRNAMRITDCQPLLNMPLMLLKASVELDFDHMKTMQTAYTLYAEKLISYPFTVQNTIPFGVWKLMLPQQEKSSLQQQVGQGGQTDPYAAPPQLPQRRVHLQWLRYCNHRASPHRPQP